MLREALGQTASIFSNVWMNTCISEYGCLFHGIEQKIYSRDNDVILSTRTIVSVLVDEEKQTVEHLQT